MGEFFALVLSFFVIGLGQFYNGQALKGLLLFVGGIVLAVFTFGVLAIPVWLYGMFDAYTVAKKKSSQN